MYVGQTLLTAAQDEEKGLLSTTSVKKYESQLALESDTGDTVINLGL